MDILGEKIEEQTESVNVEILKYNKENPRVYTVLYEEQDSGNTIDDDIIYEKMLSQPSVEKYKQDIYENGLAEPILIRWDTQEVIEGNSRLTIFRYWHKQYPDDDKWKTIDCRIVSTLTERQQDWYLNKIHIEGKTPWLAYEKANSIYRRHEQGVSIAELKERFGVGEVEINKRISIIQMMKDNQDEKLDNFSYYEILERNSRIKPHVEQSPELKSLLFKKIKQNNQEFTALQMRDKLPEILKSRKHTKKFIKEKNLDTVYEVAKKSDPDNKLRLAFDKVSSVKITELKRLDNNKINILENTLRKLKREVKRIEDMIKQCKQ